MSLSAEGGATGEEPCIVEPLEGRGEFWVGGEDLNG